jgi:excisionase family DNA binding protein
MTDGARVMPCDFQPRNRTAQNTTGSENGAPDGTGCNPLQAADLAAPWLTPTMAAHVAQVGKSAIYREVRAGRLRAARVGGRRELRIARAWLDAWLESQAQPR